jgi:hypothetical protein
MTDLLATIMLLAQDSPAPGRGDNPDDGGAVLIIAGIALAVLIGGFLLHAAFHRFGRSKPRAMEHRPAPPGRVGRVSEFEDGTRR